MKKLFVLIGYSLFFLSCSHLSDRQSSQHEISHSLTPTQKVYGDLKSPYLSSYAKLPDEQHHKVDMWVRYFTGSGRELMKTYLERSSRYIPLMKSVIREAGLPEDLVYIALIESGFSPKAHSRANAVGYWQFIKSTGKRYGLRINHFVDERRDPVLSTRAAMAFFTDLYSLFESWPLALSAYNAGEYKINRAVLKHYNRNFWYLISKKSLPSETSNYVPKFIAAKRIARDPGKYGFSNLQYQNRLNYDTVSVKQSVSLKKLAVNLDMSYEDLKKLNPMYRGEYVPVYGNDTTLRVPAGLQARAEQNLKNSSMPRPKYAYLDHYWYRVRRGDTLSQIARRNRTSVGNLRRANRIRGRSSLIRVGQRLKIPTRKLSAVSLKRKKSPAPRSHKVVRGDTLSKLSKRYGVSVSQIKTWNNLRTGVIHIGQNLRLTSAPVKAADPTFHIVRKGETLIGIADKYKISLLKLMKVNSLTFKSILLTGTRLNIPR